MAFRLKHIFDYNPPFTKDYEVVYSVLENNYIYWGILKNNIPIIEREQNGVKQVAQNVTDLDTDWIDRGSLTYV